jgi:two-component system NtrC family response regulator
MTHEWRGNVRELKNLIERLVILHAGEEIKAQDIKALLSVNPLEGYEKLFMQMDLKSAKREFEKIFIERKFREYNYDLKKVSEVIKLYLSNLYRKIRQYGIKMEGD